MKGKIYTQDTPSIATLNPLDMHQEFRSKNITQNGGRIVVANQTNSELPTGQVLDLTDWLPHAAPHYHISKDIRDFVMVPVVTVPSDLPNRNGVGFPLRTLTEFIPDAGMFSYQTFKGKPTYYEHQNKDITKAKGVIADSFLRPMSGYGGGRIFKLVKLLCFDRQKDSILVERILSTDPDRRINTYSMGAYLSGCECSYCEKEVGKCSHIDEKKPVAFYALNGHIVHRVMTGVVGFETSAVESPAWMTAISDDIVSRPG